MIKNFKSVGMISACKSKGMTLAKVKTHLHNRHTQLSHAQPHTEVPSIPTSAACHSVIVSAHEQKDLGVIVTDDLSWSCHYNKICKKAYLSLHLIKRALPASASVLLKKQLFISLVRSHFSYCSQLWKPLHVKDILSLERVQRRATKFILNDYVSDYKTRLRRLSFLPLSLWLDLRDVMQMSTKQE